MLCCIGLAGGSGNVCRRPIICVSHRQQHSLLCSATRPPALCAHLRHLQVRNGGVHHVLQCRLHLVLVLRLLDKRGQQLNELQ